MLTFLTSMSKIPMANVFDIHVKNSNVGLEMYKTCFTAVSVE
jgi:hypothetical protein